jgi:hypothetical protein
MRKTFHFREWHRRPEERGQDSSQEVVSVMDLGLVYFLQSVQEEGSCWLDNILGHEDVNHLK